MNINVEQIKRKISKLGLKSLAKSSGFQKRKPQKIDIIGFIGGFWSLVNSSQSSLSCWARHISYFTNVSISKQALDKRLRNVNDLGEQFLDQVIKAGLNVKDSRYAKLFFTFSNVLLEDSTCINLPKNLADFFPGAKNRHGQNATAKIQFRMNLFNDLCTAIKLNSFKDSDAKHAPDIVTVLQKGDLVIRDLGYWSLKTFRAIAAKQAYFLTRYKFGTCLFRVSGESLYLLKHLKKAHRNGQQTVQLDVLVGKKEQLPARLIAIKTPQTEVLKRKKKAKQNRDQRLKHSKEYYDLLEWTIFITNVEKEIWKPKQVLQAYGLRWRIEIIFKCWKSKFKMASFFKTSNSLNPNRARITIYLFLAMIVAFYTNWYALFSQLVYKETGKELSPIKFADFVKEHFWELLLNTKKWEERIPLIAYNFSYEKRRRPNHLFLLFNPLG